jgi:hypothetical protein
MGQPFLCLKHVAKKTDLLAFVAFGYQFPEPRTGNAFQIHNDRRPHVIRGEFLQNSPGQPRFQVEKARMQVLLFDQDPVRVDIAAAS